jgi:hypothetical protein
LVETRSCCSLPSILMRLLFVGCAPPICVCRVAPLGQRQARQQTLWLGWQACWQRQQH